MLLSLPRTNVRTFVSVVASNPMQKVRAARESELGRRMDHSSFVLFLEHIACVSEHSCLLKPEACPRLCFYSVLLQQWHAVAALAVRKSLVLLKL